MKYNFGNPVEAMYTTDNENNDEYSKITFHLNRRLKSIERNTISGRNKNPNFLSYQKFEYDIHGEFDGICVNNVISDDKRNIDVHHYQHGKLISQI